jgi:hypothetical protein
MTAISLIYRCAEITPDDEETPERRDLATASRENLLAMLDASLELNVALKRALEIARDVHDDLDASLKYTEDDLDWLTARAEERGALWAMRAMRDGSAALDPVDVCRKARAEGGES